MSTSIRDVMRRLGFWFTGIGGTMLAVWGLAQTGLPWGVRTVLGMAFGFAVGCYWVGPGVRDR